MTLYELFLCFVLAAIAYAVWVHAAITRIASSAVVHYCAKEGVQLLDQNVVLKQLSLSRSPHTLFAFKRRYGFEFSSVGDFRYQGSISLIGNRVSAVELEPFKVT